METTYHEVLQNLPVRSCTYISGKHYPCHTTDKDEIARMNTHVTKCNNILVLLTFELKFLQTKAKKSTTVLLTEQKKDPIFFPIRHGNYISQVLQTLPVRSRNYNSGKHYPSHTTDRDEIECMSAHVRKCNDILSLLRFKLKFLQTQGRHSTTELLPE